MNQKFILDHYPLPTKDIPQGWQTVSIAQVARLVASGFPSGDHNQEQRGTPHIRPMNIDREGQLNLDVLKYVEGGVPRELTKGDVIFNNTNSPELIGKTTAILIDRRLAYSNHMTRIQLEDGLDPAFVARQLHFLWMSGYFRHRCVNHVNQASISAEPLSGTVPLLLPPSKEQIRITDTLDELLSDLDAGVAALVRVREKLKLFRASLLKAAVEGTLTTEWREQHPQIEPASELLKRILAERRRRWEEDQLRKFKEKDQAPPKNWKARYDEPVAPDTTKLRGLPEGWCWATVDQCSTIIQYGSSAKASEDARGVPVLRMGNLRSNGSLVLDDLKYLPSEHEEFPSLLLSSGDLLFNRTNSAELVGKTGLYNGTPSPCSFASYLIRVRLTNLLLPQFLMYAINGGLGRAWIRDVVNQTVGQANVNGTKLAGFTFPLPPFLEQEAIVEVAEDQLSGIDHLEAGLDTKSTSAGALRQSLLRHAFTGQLVPQDPNDEPASELIKSIATGREQSTRDAATAKRNGKSAKSSHTARRGRKKKDAQG